MSKAGQLMIAFICGMDRDHPIVRNLMSDAKALGRELMTGSVIESHDLFDAIDNRHSFFEYPETWNNLPEIMEAIRKGGSKVEAKQFTDIIMNGRSALDYAIEKDAVKKLFQPEIWTGLQAEMERVWFRIPQGKREPDFFLQTRRSIAAAEGRTLREDELAAMEISIQQLRNAVASGDYKAIREKMAKKGDYLRATDVFLLDNYGDHTLDTESACRRFEQLHAELALHGECLKADDFLFSHFGRKSALETALAENQIDKFFTADIWRNRLDEMMKLLEHVPEFRRKALKIDDIVRKIEEEAYATRIQVAPGLKKGMLTEAMNNAAGAPVRGLGLKKVWDEMPAIRQILKQGSESITVEDLHLPCGREGDNAMLAAARFGKFDAVIDILTEQGAPLTAADLCGKTKDGDSILDILIEKKQLGLVMKPALWVDRRDEFKTVWAALPDKTQEEIGFQDFVSQMNFIALRRKFGAGSAPAP